MRLPPPPTPTSGDSRVLDDALHRAAGLVLAASALAVALDELGAIDLPPGLESQVDQAQLRAIASLYLASDLERAGVLPAVEMLAGLGRSGGLGIDLGRAGLLVEHFWKSRNERATVEERTACFNRLFGAAPSDHGGFDDAMLEMCEALYKLDENATNATYGGVAQQARVRASATRLVSQLADAGGGITVFLAKEILQGLRDALAILGSPDLRGAFGARDIWGVVAGIDRVAHTSHDTPLSYVRRGKAGMTVLAWLADAAPHLDVNGGVLVGLDHPVISAAIDWMQAALEIGESGATAGATAPVASPAPNTASAPYTGSANLPASPWAAIA